MSVAGDGVNESFTGSLLTPWNPTHLSVGTNSTSFPGAVPYFDDIHAAVDELPVPTHASTWGRLKALYR